jgi:hypothetical protein
VTAIDAFDDLDRHPSVRGFSLPRDFGVGFSAQAAARAASRIACDSVIYLSNFENHPRAVRALAENRQLLGNPPDVLCRVRNPLELSRALARRGFAVPAIRMNENENENVSNAPNDSNDPNDWIVKPLRSGGGHGVRRWTPDMRVPRGFYLQERIDGVAASVVFVAAGGRAVPLAITRQLIGEAAFGADGYRYCGNILAGADDSEPGNDEALQQATTMMVTAVAEEFGLIGLNGIDFIAQGSIPYPIEVNPRWCSSMELVEEAYSVSLFQVHVDACVENGSYVGRIPVSESFEASRTRHASRTRRAFGKAIVFAREDVVTGDTREWLAEPAIRDVPHPGEHIGAGRPVCSVFASDETAAACYAGLVRTAERVYAELGRWNKLFSGGTTALHHERGPHDQAGPANQRGQR